MLAPLLQLLLFLSPGTVPALLTPAVASPAVLDVVLPRPSELTAASGDAVELERLASRLGAARMLALFGEYARAGQGRPAVVALRAIGLMALQNPDQACQLLPGLLDALPPLVAAHRLDDKLGAALGDTLGRIGEGVGIGWAHSDIDGQLEQPGSPALAELSEQTRRLLELAQDPQLPTALRDAALAAMSSYPVAAWVAHAPRLALLAQSVDASPGRAAMVALGILGQHERSPELLDIALGHSDPRVASAAAAEICLLATPPQRRVGQAATGLLSAALAARVRALAAADFAIVQRQRLGECLRLLGTPHDRALWQAIQTAAKRPHR